MTPVLVVDDSDTMRQLVRSMLEPAGCLVSEAPDGVDGIDALRAAPAPQVVLLDYHMPRMDGWQVLQTVAAEGAPLAAHEFIVITADVSTFPETSIDLLRHVSVRILPKPFSKEALVTIVTQALDRLRAPAAATLPTLSDPT